MRRAFHGSLAAMHWPFAPAGRCCGLRDQARVCGWDFKFCWVGAQSAISLSRQAGEGWGGGVGHDAPLPASPAARGEEKWRAGGLASRDGQPYGLRIVRGDRNAGDIRLRRSQRVVHSRLCCRVRFGFGVRVCSGRVAIRRRRGRLGLGRTASLVVEASSRLNSRPSDYSAASAASRADNAKPRYPSAAISSQVSRYAPTPPIYGMNTCGLPGMLTPMYQEFASG